jgi:serine/threonine protein kinase, bacterial
VCTTAANSTIISQHLKAEPPKLSDRRPDLAMLDEVMSVALAKNPDDRFHRCRDFASALGERATDASRSDRATETAIPIAAPIPGPASFDRDPTPCRRTGRSSGPAP